MKLTVKLTWELTEPDGNMPEFQTARKAIEDVLEERCLVEAKGPNVPPYVTHPLCEQVYIEGEEEPIYIRIFGVDELTSK